jgi:U1 small nuclear ribonucleoprotein
VISHLSEQKLKIKAYNPDKDENVHGDPKKTIFVGRLNYKTDETKLEENFGIYGTIKHLKIVRNIHTNKSKGYAFIEFAETRQAEIAYKRADYKRIDDTNILVDMEQARIDKYWLPKRLGGGKGGDKRRANKEHQDYIREIKRDLRKQDKSKNQVQDAKSKSDIPHVETTKRQKITETTEVKNPEISKTKQTDAKQSNQGFVAKTLAKNLDPDSASKN